MRTDLQRSLEEINILIARCENALRNCDRSSYAKWSTETINPVGPETVRPLDCRVAKRSGIGKHCENYRM